MQKSTPENQHTKHVDDAALNLVSILFRNKGLLVISGFVGLGLGAAYFFLLPPKYESRAELLLMRNDSGSIASGNTGSESTVSDDLLATHLKLIQSNRIVTKALEEGGELLLPARVDEFGDEVDGDSSVLLPQLPELNPANPSATVTEPATTPAPTTPAAVTTPAEAAPAATASAATTDAAAPETTVVADSATDAAAAATTEAALTGAETPSADMPSAEGDALAQTTETLEESMPVYPPGSLMNLPSLSPEAIGDQSPVKYVINNLYVTSGGGAKARGANVLNLAFRHSSPEDSKKIVEALLVQYQKFVREKFQDSNSEAAKLIGNARGELEKEIADLYKNYQVFRENSPLLTGGEGGTDIYTARYETLAAELSNLAVKMDDTKSRLELVNTGTEMAEKNGSTNLEKLALIDEANVQRLGVLVAVEHGQADTAIFQAMQPERAAGAQVEYTSLLSMKGKLKQLTDDYGAQHPEVRALKQQIAEMTDFIGKRAKNLEITDNAVELTTDDIMKAYVHMLQNDLASLGRRYADVEKQMKAAEIEAKELVALQLTDETMTREISRREELYASTIDRLREINMAKDSTALVHEIIAEPNLGEKVEPTLLLAVAIALLSSFTLGGVGVLVAEMRDKSIRNSEELEAVLGTRILGNISNFANDSEVTSNARKLRRTLPNVSPYIVAWHMPKSKHSEAFMSVRTQLAFALGGDRKIFAITSASKGAGKSTLVSNIAVSMATNRQSVLLVDCDMRLPTIHTNFGIENKHGLVDVLLGEKELPDVMVPGPVPGLTLLPTGGLPQNPAELLASPMFKQFLESVREKFSYVILDCPPVLPVTDPSIIAPLTDGLLVVSVINSQSRPQTERTKKILEGVGAKLLGVVVNLADDSASKYGYDSYGYEGYDEYRSAETNYRSPAEVGV
ncbi:MAG: polysaccharide biosynthesis tyrosine autokinase [Pirellulaceae bacterium]|nr:polysaccharide biosynthesis tyrosine autokinase [Pirellulaceae bacterium]